MTGISTARPITSKELAVFCRQVGAMLMAGVDILRALQVASDQSGSERLKRVTASLRHDLENGRLLATALGRYPDLFSPFFVSMVHQGEREGVLGQVLSSLADYLDREHGGAPGHVAGLAAGAFDIDAAIEKLKPLIFWQMLTLGAIALGIAWLWWAHMLEWLPAGSFGPNIALWVGLCIFLSALIFHRYHPPRVARCSFCGRAETDRAVLVQGHGVAICPDCLRSNIEQLKALGVESGAPDQTGNGAAERPYARASRAGRGAALEKETTIEAPSSAGGEAVSDAEVPEEETEPKRIEL